MDAGLMKLLALATLSRYTFRLRPIGRIVLPGFKGIPFRGGFGKALLQTVCPENVCKQDDCPQLFHCAYSYIFETPVPLDAEVLRLNKNVAHPFIIGLSDDSRITYEYNDILEMNLTLIGKAVEYLPYCILAFERLGMTGIGKGRGKYLVESVSTLKDDVETMVFSGKEKRLSGKGYSVSFASIMSGREADRQRWFQKRSLEITFVTPGRFEYDGEVVTRELEFHILFRSILRRLSTLLYFHCNNVTLPIDYKQFIGDAMSVKIDGNNLSWQDYRRYSTRREKRMTLGGLTGTIRYQGNLEPFIPFLLLAEYIHVGKSVSFGFGKISVR
ncbi:MAG: CRISPR system precrRNA processing endoribonuclease RAMP protein Cas6 [wastewater metagenome]|nr:CRISPR system precrRNA processing endoribonuclease RAMP protein Cas6 [Candidatus Loosdrechtia aerotolerans]